MSDRTRRGDAPRDSDIEPERIAALLDGKVGEEERAELLRMLAVSRSFHELTETAAVLRELEEFPADAASVHDALAVSPPIRPPGGPERAPPSMVRGRRWRRRWAALASVAALVLLAPLVWRAAAGGADVGTPASLLAFRDAGLPANWTADRPWPATLGEAASLTPTARAVRAGALHTDLLLGTGDTAQVARLRAEMSTLLSGVEGAAGLNQAYSATGQEVGQALASAGAALEQLLGPDEVRWGAWLEAARIAAVRRDAAFFRVRASRAALDRAARLASLPAAVRTRAGSVRNAIDTAPPDWPALSRELNRLLRDSAS
jgi:hypothetical protein